MKQGITHPESRARRAIALAKSYASMLGIPITTVATIRDAPAHALASCRALTNHIAATAGRKKASRLVLEKGPLVAVTLVEDPELFGRSTVRVRRARLDERERCARIVRYGIERNVTAFAAAFAFETNMSCDGAFRRMDQLANLTSTINRKWTSTE